MTALLLSFLILLAGAIAAAALRCTRTQWIGPWSAIAGAAIAAFAGLHSLIAGTTVDIAAPWQVPMGSLHVGLDPLSALFVSLIAVVGVLAAAYGRGYLADDPGNGKVAMSWCWYNLLIAAMLLVVVARDGFLFLLAWEAMSLSSFFLVMFDHEKDEVMRAGWTYLVAAHLGTAFLLIMFLLLGAGGGLDFAALSASGLLASIVFAMALIGFGTKAGFVPLHVWLPEAHPAAPSHVSALMSGVMIKTGIYGLLRVMTFLKAPDAWWGWALIVIGAVSGVVGVLFALAQHDLKRLLAYHSVENIGIIALGLGIGILGDVSGNPVVAAMGFCGALLHVVNHGIFKSLLFLGAGSVLHATGTRAIDRLGGLIKPMPVTGAAFLVGAVAICALPPLNGFVSEFLVYSAAFSSVAAGPQVWGGIIVIGSLALIGGLAAACFTKAFGAVFLGEPRTRDAVGIHEAPLSMCWPMVTLAALCVFIGLTAAEMVRLVMPAVAQLTPAAINAVLLKRLPDLMTRISIAALVLAGLTALLASLRSMLLRRRTVRTAVTWDCGYAAPSARMQYTASSYAQPLIGMFQTVLRTRCDLQKPRGLFPAGASLHNRTPDLFVQGVYGPAIRGIVSLANIFRRVQRGQTHLYILYILVTVLLLLIWNLW